VSKADCYQKKVKTNKQTYAVVGVSNNDKQEKKENNKNEQQQMVCTIIQCKERNKPIIKKKTQPRTHTHHYSLTSIYLYRKQYYKLSKS
jgi:hypothetical protein